MLKYMPQVLQLKDSKPVLLATNSIIFLHDLRLRLYSAP